MGRHRTPVVLSLAQARRSVSLDGCPPHRAAPFRTPSLHHAPAAHRPPPRRPTTPSLHHRPPPRGASNMAPSRRRKSTAGPSGRTGEPARNSTSCSQRTRSAQRNSTVPSDFACCTSGRIGVSLRHRPGTRSTSIPIARRLDRAGSDPGRLKAVRTLAAFAGRAWRGCLHFGDAGRGRGRVSGRDRPPLHGRPEDRARLGDHGVAGAGGGQVTALPEAIERYLATAKSLTQKPTSPGHRQPLTVFEAHNGRSTFDAGTALHVKGFRTPARH